jgi:plasmid stabilization system protein ParE
MVFQVEITPVAAAQIDRAYRWYREQNPDFADLWFRGLMNTVATLQKQPQRCGLAVEHEIFPEEVRQLLYGKTKNVHRLLFTIRDTTVYLLYVRHSAQSLLTLDDIQKLEGED